MNDRPIYNKGEYMIYKSQLYRGITQGFNQRHKLEVRIKGVPEDFLVEINSDPLRYKQVGDKITKQQWINQRLQIPVVVQITDVLFNQGYYDHFGRLYIDSNTLLNPTDAHQVLMSDKVFYGVCTSRREEKRSLEFNDGGQDTYTQDTIRVRGYNKDKLPIEGILKWHTGRGGNFLMKVSRDILDGSERHGIPKVEEGSRLLIRTVSDNSHLGKAHVTYFFEPVITLTENDAAQNYNGRDLRTRVVGAPGIEKITDFQVGDIIENLPILSVKKTKSGSFVNGGYILHQDRQEGYFGRYNLKPVSVRPAEEDLGMLVKSAEIFKVSDIGYLAKRKD